MQTITMPSFEGKFEEIKIIARKLNVQFIKEAVTTVATQKAGHTSIWQSMSPSYTDTRKNLFGKALFIFRNQGEDFNSTIFLEGSFFIEAPKESDSNRTFNKFVQYIFDWTKTYVQENDVRDTNGRKFIMPHSLYSEQHFKHLFGE